MVQKRNSDSSRVGPDLFDKHFAHNLNEVFGSDTDFKAWADVETKPEEILIPENRRRYEAYLAKHDIKL
ncbi:MAG TPA: hypothetical protein VGP15_07125 [Burkholderiales bacterium]|jgi:hypothetical protein|nr:hypothetical protein [Burkholderiales bacterium]